MNRARTRWRTPEPESRTHWRLARGAFGDFAALCLRDLSDFRDVGPVCLSCVTGAAWTLEDLVLVDYSDVMSLRRADLGGGGPIRVSPLIEPSHCESSGIVILRGMGRRSSTV
jgi:hypothetical protein